MLEHDPETNRLKIKPGHDPPWLRVNPPAGDPNTWQYCAECYDTWVKASNRSGCHVPFRDRASQSSMRPSWRSQQKREELIEEERRLNEEAEAAREHEAEEVAQPESEPEAESEPCLSEAEPDIAPAQDGKSVGPSASEAEDEIVLPAVPQ